MLIAHLGDIHIYSHYTDDDFVKMYDVVFERTYAKLRELKPAVIVIAGDVFHNKLYASTEEIICAIKFINTLADIAHVVMIPGNHDMEVKYPDDNSLLTAILPCLRQNVQYLHHNGYYKDNLYDIIWHVVFNNTATSCEQLAEATKSCIRIGLFHNEIAGAVMPSGYICKANYIYKSNFVDDKFVMGGHIHKQQAIADNMWYCGSLIQQNLGESEDEHGFLLWDTDSAAVTRVIIRNEYAGVTIKIAGGGSGSSDSSGTIESVESVAKTKLWQIKFYCPKIPAHMDIIKKYTDYMGCKPKNIVFNCYDKSKLPLLPLLPLSPALHPQLSLLPPTRDTDIKLLEQYLTSKAVKGETIEKIKKFHSINSSHLPMVSKTIIKLTLLKFENILCYRKGEINFEHISNCLSGVEAPNGMGKSTILTVVLMAFYGKFAYANVISKLPGVGRGTPIVISLDFYVDSVLYNITRTVYATSVNLEVSKQGTILKNFTNDNIIELVGTKESMTNLSFLSDSLVTATPAKRTEYIAKVLNLGRFDSIYKKISEEKTLQRGKLSAYSHCKQHVNNKDMYIEEYNKIKNITDDYSDHEIDNEIVRITNIAAAATAATAATTAAPIEFNSDASYSSTIQHTKSKLDNIQHLLAQAKTNLARDEKILRDLTKPTSATLSEKITANLVSGCSGCTFVAQNLPTLVGVVNKAPIKDIKASIEHSKQEIVRYEAEVAEINALLPGMIAYALKKCTDNKKQCVSVLKIKQKATELKLSLIHI